MVPTSLPEHVRQHCAAVARSARWVRIDDDATVPAGGIEGLDPGLHYLDGSAEDVVRGVFILDAINFGSGWLPELFASATAGTVALTARLAEHARRPQGPWVADELQAITTQEVAAVLALPVEHTLTRYYATALRQLGDYLAGRSALAAIAAAEGSAARLAAQLADAMPYFDDPGFYKRAQITANDLVLAGVAEFADIDDLTVFADNVVPHVLRRLGVLVYDAGLARMVDAGEPLAAGGAMETEVRAAAVHACERIARGLGVPPRRLDNWLWNRGAGPAYASPPPHRTFTVHY